MSFPPLEPEPSDVPPPPEIDPVDTPYKDPFQYPPEPDDDTRHPDPIPKPTDIPPPA